MGTNQSTVPYTYSYKCPSCEGIFHCTGNERLKGAKCESCADREQNRESNTLMCSLCRKVFPNEHGYLPPEFRAHARCNECAALFQKQMEEGDYKHVEVEGRQYVYPTTMEESVQQRFVRTKPAITDKEQNPSNKLFD